MINIGSNTNQDLTISCWDLKMDDKKLLQKTRNLFVKLKVDLASVLFAEELLDKIVKKNWKNQDMKERANY